MNTSELLGKYYGSLSKKAELGALLSEDFTLRGTGMKGGRGRAAHDADLFFDLLKSLKVKDIILDGERACVLVAYELALPKGGQFSCEVAEIWQAKGGKLVSLEMFFDTVEFQKFITPVLFPLSIFKRKKAAP